MPVTANDELRFGLYGEVHIMRIIRIVGMTINRWHVSDNGGIRGDGECEFVGLLSSDPVL